MYVQYKHSPKYIYVLSPFSSFRGGGGWRRVIGEKKEVKGKVKSRKSKSAKEVGKISSFVQNGSCSLSGHPMHTCTYDVCELDQSTQSSCVCLQLSFFPLNLNLLIFYTSLPLSRRIMRQNNIRIIITIVILLRRMFACHRRGDCLRTF